jgi:hypothetical protein
MLGCWIHMEWVETLIGLGALVASESDRYCADLGQQYLAIYNTLD